MVVLVICKNEEHPIKNEGARVFTTLLIKFTDAQGQITLESVVVSGQNLNSSNFKCMSSLPERMKMIQSKMKVLEWSQHFSRYKSLGFFPDAEMIWQNFKLVRDFMVVIVTCKHEEDPIKNEGTRVFTTLYINFSDAQRQITCCRW